METVAVHVESIAESIRGDVKRSPIAPRSRERHSTATTMVLGNGVATQILGHSPKRRRAVITVVGQSTDVVYLCTSMGDAQQFANAPAATVTSQGPGAAAMGLQVIELTGTDEWWAYSTTVPALGIIAEFED